MSSTDFCSNPTQTIVDVTNAAAIQPTCVALSGATSVPFTPPVITNPTCDDTADMPVKYTLWAYDFANFNTDFYLGASID